MASFGYDRDYDPAAAVVEIYLRTGRSAQIGPYDALLDSGADVSLIPYALIQQIEAPRLGRRFARSHWGERRPVELFAVILSIGEVVIHGAHVIGDRTGAELILGRNVLNQLRVILDGPGERVDIS